MDAEKKVAGVILAAGDSSRFGKNKLLLDWHGIPLIRHIAEQAIHSKFAEVLLVAGHQAELVYKAVKDLSLKHVENRLWQNGQSSSIIAAMAQIGKEIDGVCFLLGDQPFISSTLIDELIKAFQKSNADILIPYFGNQRSNPLIFSRTTFHSLSQLKGDEGGRQIIGQFNTEKFQWQDSRILKEIDTQADYQTLLDEEKN